MRAFSFIPNPSPYALLHHFKFLKGFSIHRLIDSSFYWLSNSLLIFFIVSLPSFTPNSFLEPSIDDIITGSFHFDNDFTITLIDDPKIWPVSILDSFVKKNDILIISTYYGWSEVGNHVEAPHYSERITSLWYDYYFVYAYPSAWVLGIHQEDNWTLL